jgi:hypothetical protein
MGVEHDGEHPNQKAGKSLPRATMLGQLTIYVKSGHPVADSAKQSQSSPVASAKAGAQGSRTSLAPGFRLSPGRRGHGSI